MGESTEESRELIQPQRFAAPPPPHFICPGQSEPQSIVLPQPSETIPHWAPTCAQFFGVQPQALATPPPPQVSGGVHAPPSDALQWRMPPQPSDKSPQASIGHVMGWHGRSEQMPALHHDAPASAAFAHWPHETVLPQPSGYVPHEAPRSVQRIGWHVHWFDAQTMFAPPHAPQKSDPPQPSSTESPHCAFASGQVRGRHMAPSDAGASSPLGLASPPSSDAASSDAAASVAPASSVGAGGALERA
jgi:hypothetical protein